MYAAGMSVNSDRYLFVYNDLQMIDLRTTPTRLAHRIVSQIARQCPDPEIQSIMDILAPVGNHR